MLSVKNTELRHASHDTALDTIALEDEDGLISKAIYR